MAETKIRCLIIDDEPLSREILKDYAGACPELELCGIYPDALSTGETLRKEKADLLFLDINMPKLSGINFIKSLPNPPLVIFITAYPEYAVDGFEVDAVDYLLKPVSFERFRKAVNRALERIQNRSLPSKSEINHILVKADKKNYRIDFDNLICLEAIGDYVRFFVGDKKLMVHGTLKDFLSQLPANRFARIHKTYVVNTSKIDYIEGNTVKLGSFTLPLSLSFRDEFFSILKNNS
jgi:two-component system, LytTR family, response regulator